MKRFQIISFLFLSSIIFSIIKGKTLVRAMLFGLILFSYDALKKGYSFKEVLKMMLEGLKSVKNLLIIFTLIGFLTASWRASGTIAYLVYHGLKFINPKFFILYCFLLPLGMSMLIGSVTGTATTVGVILISIARAAGINLYIATGAILSGAMYGDRMSPVSSSASLVAELTGTKQNENIKPMWDTAKIPTLISIAIFAIISILGSDAKVDASVFENIKNYIKLSNFNMIPALAIIICAIFKLKTKTMIIISTILAIFEGSIVQKTDIRTILKALFFGIRESNVEVLFEKIINGGGVDSMSSMMLIVAISSAFFGIFNHTKFLQPIYDSRKKLERKIGFLNTENFFNFLFAIIFCNQTVPVISINEIYKDDVSSHLRMLDMENGAILISALIPWNMAANPALTIYEVGYPAVLFNFYCMAVPIYYYFIRNKIKGKLENVIDK